MKKILFVGAEAMPFAATGGLGDVMGSLPTAIVSEGAAEEQAKTGEDADVRVVMPLYDAVGENWRAMMREEWVGTVALGWRQQYCGIRSLVRNGVTYYFIDNEYYFKRGGLYGQYDDGERYAFFCMAVMELMAKVDFFPDVLHAHDWQSALSIVYLNLLYRQKPGYEGIRTVFTIHNIEYQGLYDIKILGDVFALPQEAYPIMEYHGCLNLMKAAIECADIVSTVSPHYAEEIRTPDYAHGLSGLLSDYGYKLRGILNGIDYEYYNPETDAELASHYCADHREGKTGDKTALQRETALPERTDVPLLAIISRLASHKGLDLFTKIAYNLMETRDVQLVILGRGEVQYEQFFRELEAHFPGKVRALLTYDRALSKRIYAAADIFLMPSRSEPCGLSQMIASRYGAIPVVRETGGLYDSIKGYWENEQGEVMGNGFTFANYCAGELQERTCAAIDLWNDLPRREALVDKIMHIDFSWKVSARAYLAMYRDLF